MADTTSRLLTNSEELRNNLESRNLYTPENEYPLDSNTASKVIDTISQIGSIISPFKSTDLKNSVVGRLIADRTPLSEISLVCLGKQMAYNIASNASRDYMPTVNILNVVDNNPDTHLIILKKDYRITPKVNQNGVGNFLNNFYNIYPSYTNILKNATNKELIENTGSGQLEIRDNMLNHNLFVSDYQKTSEYVEIKHKSNVIKNSSFLQNVQFKFFSEKYNKKFENSDEANLNMAQSYTKGSNYEYGNDEYVTEHLGVGRLGVYYDNIDTKTNSWLTRAPINIIWNSNEMFKNVNGGLLEYTRNIRIASKQKFINSNADGDDQFLVINGNNIGFNGSAVFTAPDTASPEFRGKSGIRQHSPNSPYGTNNKLIRYIGNSNYSGNKNSVLYESVFPRMHSINIENKFKKEDNKRLMFAIENLAFHVNDNGFIVNSEHGDYIDIIEVGPNNGRIMWFPPYDLTINETSTAKFTPTVFLGRNEPIYNYENSERSATINFKLIADFPPQLYNLQGKTSKDIAEFFAFGGDYDGIKKQEVKPKPNNTPVKEFTEYNSKSFQIYFPNDIPNDNVDTVLNGIADSEYQLNDGNYEVLYAAKTLNNGDIYTYNSTFDPLNNFLNTNLQKYKCRIEIFGNASKLYGASGEEQYNKELSQRRIDSVKSLINSRISALNLKNVDIEYVETANGSAAADPSTQYEANKESTLSIEARRVDFVITTIDYLDNNFNTTDVVNKTEQQFEVVQTDDINYYNKRLSSQIGSSASDTLNNSSQTGNNEAIIKNYFMPVYHSQTPEDFHRRLTFLQQCTRQGAAQRVTDSVTGNARDSIRNSVFGRQPICVLRIGDFFYTKVVIHNINIDYKESLWDLNPEGFGLQPLIADVTLQVHVIGGQSLEGPISLLQNAISFNYYANSTYTNKGIYKISSQAVVDEQTNYGKSTNKDNSVTNNKK